MSYRFIPTSNEETWRSTTHGFNKYANFPNCVGAVDGKLVRIQKPGRSRSFYFNYKHYCSVVLLAVADSNFRFVYADAGSYGRDSHASIFRNCSLWQTLLHRWSLTHVKPTVHWTAPAHSVKHCSSWRPLWHHRASRNSRCFANWRTLVVWSRRYND
jgi:hypothetical protein